MLLMELPVSFNTKNVASNESGIEKKTAIVALRLPRNIKIIRQVRKRPTPPSCSRVVIAVFTNLD